MTGESKFRGVIGDYDTGSTAKTYLSGVRFVQISLGGGGGGGGGGKILTLGACHTSSTS